MITLALRAIKIQQCDNELVDCSLPAYVVLRWASVYPSRLRHVLMDS